jgi:hypothetical protein
MMGGSGAGCVIMTNKSGRPKNIRIRMRIRIPNTGSSQSSPNFAGMYRCSGGIVLHFIQHFHLLPLRFQCVGGCWTVATTPYPGSGVKKELKYFNPKKSSSSPGLFIPDPDSDFLPIPDPGVKKVPDPGSGSATHWLRLWHWPSDALSTRLVYISFKLQYFYHMKA